MSAVLYIGLYQWQPAFFTPQLRWQRAMDLLGVIAADRLEATVITYNVAISSCAGSGQWHAALWILSGMGKTGLESNVITYTSAVNACHLALENGPKGLRGKF